MNRRMDTRKTIITEEEQGYRKNGGHEKIKKNWNKKKIKVKIKWVVRKKRIGKEAEKMKQGKEEWIDGICLKMIGEQIGIAQGHNYSVQTLSHDPAFRRERKYSKQPALPVKSHNTQR